MVYDPSSEKLFHFVKPLLYSGIKTAGKEALKTGSNIITDVLNKKSREPVSNIFKNRFGESKDNLEQKIENVTWFGLGLKSASWKRLILKVNVER